MAAKASKPKEKVVKYPYPSFYGSHTSMIDQEATDKLEDKTLVVLKDEFGTYTTFRNRLDSGLADPKRYAEARLTKFHEEAKRLTAKIKS